MIGPTHSFSDWEKTLSDEAEKKDSTLRDGNYSLGYQAGFWGNPNHPLNDHAYKLRYLDDYNMGYADGQGDAVSELRLERKWGPSSEHLWAVHQTTGTEKWYYFERLDEAITMQRNLK